MIGAFAEGVAQSLLPCSWILLFPAAVVGLAARRVGALAAFAGTVVLTAWAAVAGWIIPALWLIGVALLAGGLLWWRLGATFGPVALVGVGAAWAWQPCAGPELGEALTTAQYDPWVALGGLAMFLLGVLLVGMVVGRAGAAVLEQLGKGS